MEFGNWSTTNKSCGWVKANYVEGTDFWSYSIQGSESYMSKQLSEWGKQPQTWSSVRLEMVLVQAFGLLHGLAQGLCALLKKCICLILDSEQIWKWLTSSRMEPGLLHPPQNTFQVKACQKIRNENIQPNNSDDTVIWKSERLFSSNSSELLSYQQSCTWNKL